MKKQTMIKLMTALLPLTFIAGCGGGGSSSLTFSGSLTPHANEKMFLALIDTTGNTDVVVSRPGSLNTVIADDGSFSMSLPLTLNGSSSYKIAFYADHNKNGQCDSPTAVNAPNIPQGTTIKVDHSWVVPVEKGVILTPTGQTFNHNTNFVDVCDFFKRDLTFNGSMPAALHAGEQLSIAVIDDANSSAVVKAQTKVDSLGKFSFHWPELLRDSSSYHAELYVEHGGKTTACDTPPVDHSWSEALPAVKGQAITHDFNHRTPFDAVCNTFTPHQVSFTGSLTTLHASQLLNVALVADQDGIFAKKGDVIERMSATNDAQGMFAFTFTTLLEHGLSYHVDMYVDITGEGVCDRPPVDHSWRESLGVIAAPTSHSFTHRTSFDEVCASFP